MYSRECSFINLKLFTVNTSSEDNTTYNSPWRVFIACRTTFVNLMKMLSFYKPACLSRQKVNSCHTFAAEKQNSHFKVFKVFCSETRSSK